MVCKIAMDIRDDHRTFANCGCHPLHGLGTYVADGIHSRYARGVGRAVKTVCAAGENETLLI
jgi:hypothetical protein